MTDSTIAEIRDVARDIGDAADSMAGWSHPSFGEAVSSLPNWRLRDHLAENRAFAVAGGAR